MALRREVVADFLGPVDGHASERTLEVIERFVRKFEAARTPEIDALRGRLARHSDRRLAWAGLPG